MIERWQMAVRDHPNRPPALQRLVLYSLALRMNWPTGAGFASVSDLAGDSDASNRTVIYATRWAQRADLLRQTKRGGRAGNGVVRASEWQLLPMEWFQGATGGTLSYPQAKSQGAAGRTLTESQGANGAVSRCSHSTTINSPNTSRARAGESPNGARAPTGAPMPVDSREAILARWYAGKISIDEKREQLAALGGATATRKRRS